MKIGTIKRMSLEEYLIYDDGTDTGYELVDGVLVAMGAESTTNTWVASFLIVMFANMGIPYYRIGVKQKIVVPSRFVTARDPDLIIHSDDSALTIKGRQEACLNLNEPNPLLVIEVVSPGEPGTENYDRDYERKPAEYAARGIPEYWLIDPLRRVVLVMTLVGAAYQKITFTGNQAIVSLQFPDLTLTAEQVLRAGE